MHGVVRFRQRGRQVCGQRLTAQLAVLLDLGQTHLAFAGNARRLAPLFAGGLFLGGFSDGTRAGNLDFPLLGDHRLFFLAADGQLALGGIQLALPHGHFGIRLDRGAFLLVDGDDFRQTPHPQRVEGVVFIERMKRRLVDARQRHRFQHQAVLGQIVLQCVRHLAGKGAAVVLQFVHRVARSNRQHGIDQLAFQRFRQIIGTEGFSRQRLRGGGHTFARGHHPDIEFRRHVDAKTVLGDDRLRPQPLDFQLGGPHVDFGHLVQKRQRDAAAIQHDTLAPCPGAHHADFAGGLAVISVEKQDHQDRHDDQDDQADKPGHVWPSVIGRFAQTACPKSGRMFSN